MLMVVAFLVFMGDVIVVFVGGCAFFGWCLGVGCFSLVVVVLYCWWLVVDCWYFCFACIFCVCACLFVCRVSVVSHCVLFIVSLIEIWMAHC